MSGLLDTARFALEQARRAGAEFCDISVARGRSLQVEVQESAVVSCDMHEGVSATVRCFVNGGCGIHACHGIERGDLIYAARAAVSAARATGGDPEFKELPGASPAGTVAGLFDESLDNVDVSEASRTARECIDGARAAAPDANISGAVSYVSSEGAFVNSCGIEAEERATSVSSEVMCVIKRNGKTGSYAEFDVGRSRGDVRLSDVGQAAADGAIRYLGGKPIAGGEMPVVFGPLATSDLMATLARAACAEPIQRGRSFLCGKQDTAIAPNSLTLEDDGRFPGGMHSSSRDGEGTPRRPLVIIDHGTFSSVLHSSYTAGRDGVVSTGHGSQFGGIAPTNLRPRLGRRPTAELISAVGDGLYIESCMLAPNPVTGDVSTTIDWAFRIENGELAYPVAGVAISTNVLELLDGLCEISSDCREEPGTIMPAIRFKNVHVAGTA